MTDISKRVCLLHTQGICCQDTGVAEDSSLAGCSRFVVGKTVLDVAKQSTALIFRVKQEGEYTSGTISFLKMTGKLPGQIGDVLSFYTAPYSGKLEYSSVSL